MARQYTSKNISLTRHFQRFVESKVLSGRYQSASEVVREGLRLMEERDQTLSDLRATLAKGHDQLKRGKGTDGERFFEEIAGTNRMS
jgi:antitoxin ParD1/3/4